MKKLITALLTSIFLITSFSIYSANLDIPIPRSMPGDKGKYFLLNKQWTGNIVTIVNKRIGVSEVGFTKTEINCTTMMVRDLGYSENTLDTINGKASNGYPSKWYKLVAGSSKSDIAIFACKKP